MMQYYQLVVLYIQFHQNNNIHVVFYYILLHTVLILLQHLQAQDAYGYQLLNLNGYSFGHTYLDATRIFQDSVR